MDHGTVNWGRRFMVQAEILAPVMTVVVQMFTVGIWQSRSTLMARGCGLPLVN